MYSIPSFESYGRYENSNYGLHTLKVYMPGLTLYYSYRTVVAYWDPQDGLVVCENVFSTTTGKHLNWIDGGNKDERLPREVFEARLQAAVDRRFAVPQETSQ